MSTLNSIYVLTVWNVHDSYEDCIKWIHGYYRSKVSAVKAAVEVCEQAIGKLPPGFSRIWDGERVTVGTDYYNDDVGFIQISEESLQ